MRRFPRNMPETPLFAPPAHKPQSKGLPSKPSKQATSIVGRRPSAAAAWNTFFDAAKPWPLAFGHLLCNVWSSIYAGSKMYRGQPTLNMRRFLGNMPETHHFAPPAHKPQSKDRPTAGTPPWCPIAAATRPCSCSLPTLGGPKLISNGRGGASKLAPRYFAYLRRAYGGRKILGEAFSRPDP